MNYTYKIESELKNDFKNLKPIKGTKVFVCIYNILYKIKKKNPWLRYLLYKYSKKEGNLMTFPFFDYDENIINEADNMVFKLVNSTIKSKGYIQNENGIFIFYHQETEYFVFEKLYESQNYWWAIIDEICNLRKVLYFKIHKSVTNLFLSNKQLIFLYDGEKKYETPIITFKGDHLELIPYIAVFGIRPSTRSRFGPFYTSGTYNWAIRFAGWSRGYRQQEWYGDIITDKNGKFKKGGIIRLVTFLGKLDEQIITLYDKKDYFYPLIKWYDDIKAKSNKELEKYKKNKKQIGKWALKNHTLIVPKIKYTKDIGYFNINTEYIIDDGDNQITLSVHELKMDTLKVNWDPLYEGYEIL
jgi:hypothetical protein